MKNSTIKITLAALCLVAANGFAQTASDWETIYIKDLGKIRMPPTLEVQAGSYQSPDKSMNGDRFEYSSDRLVFQQKGLNDKKMGAYNTYARVVIGIERGEAGTYASYKQRLELTPEDVNDMDAALMEQVKDDLTGGSTITKWLGGKETVVNGMNCYTYSFERQLADNPVVQVSGYLFYDDDRMYNMVISFKSAEAAQWEDELDAMIASFKIED